MSSSHRDNSGRVKQDNKQDYKEKEYQADLAKEADSVKDASLVREVKLSDQEKKLLDSLNQHNQIVTFIKKIHAKFVSNELDELSKTNELIRLLLDFGKYLMAHKNDHKNMLLNIKATIEANKKNLSELKLDQKQLASLQMLFSAIKKQDKNSSRGSLLVYIEEGMRYFESMLGVPKEIVPVSQIKIENIEARIKFLGDAKEIYVSMKEHIASINKAVRIFIASREDQDFKNLIHMLSSYGAYLEATFSTYRELNVNEDLKRYIAVFNIDNDLHINTKELKGLEELAELVKIRDFATAYPRELTSIDRDESRVTHAYASCASLGVSAYFYLMHTADEVQEAREYIQKEDQKRDSRFKNKLFKNLREDRDFNRWIGDCEAQRNNKIQDKMDQLILEYNKRIIVIARDLLNVQVDLHSEVDEKDKKGEGENNGLRSSLGRRITSLAQWSEFFLSGNKENYLKMEKQEKFVFRAFFSRINSILPEESARFKKGMGLFKEDYEYVCNEIKRYFPEEYKKQNFSKLSFLDFWAVHRNDDSQTLIEEVIFCRINKLYKTYEMSQEDFRSLFRIAFEVASIKLFYQEAAKGFLGYRKSIGAKKESFIDKLESKMVTYLEQFPGISISDICKEMYYAIYCEREGIIKSNKKGKLTTEMKKALDNIDKITFQYIKDEEFSKKLHEFLKKNYKKLTAKQFSIVREIIKIVHDILLLNLGDFEFEKVLQNYVVEDSKEEVGLRIQNLLAELNAKIMSFYKDNIRKEKAGKKVEALEKLQGQLLRLVEELSPRNALLHSPSAQSVSFFKEEVSPSGAGRSSPSFSVMNNQQNSPGGSGSPGSNGSFGGRGSLSSSGSRSGSSSPSSHNSLDGRKEEGSESPGSRKDSKHGHSPDSKNDNKKSALDTKHTDKTNSYKK